MASFFPFKAPPSITSLYQSITTTKVKDKVDMILEPLQAMVQLALLSICPIGTKLHIQENILQLQSPTFIQPVTRWYCSDKKDDVYFLYGVIKRYLKWYNPHINKKSPVSPELYELITRMATDGLDHLFRTYRSSDSNTVIHVIQMYKSLLEYDNPERIMADEIIIDSDKNKINIDEVFENIIGIYEPIFLEVLHNMLKLMKAEEDETNRCYMMEGLNQILYKTTRAIRDWIKVNLTL